MSSDQLYSASDRELTQILVTELLTYQFCSPVQWIKVQDSIFQGLATEKLIEIGPGDILTNMARSTFKLADSETYDIACGLKRRLLSSKKDWNDIRADFVTVNGLRHREQSTAATGITQQVEEQATTISPLEADPRPATAPVRMISCTEDRPMEATEVVLSLVARALKKPRADLQRSQTIKALCGGRSTVQNEIIGDLTKEFGDLPDQPEDLEIESIGKFLEDSGRGATLGACTSALLAKVLSTKMPGGFGLSTVREYLARRWELRSGIEQRTLLLVIHHPPVDRLPTEAEVHLYLDDMVRRVCGDLEIALSQTSSGNSTIPESDATVTLSAANLSSIYREQKLQDEALYDLYAKRTGRDTYSALIAQDRAEAQVHSLQARLDTWAAEHGDVYEAGISPQFDVLKARKYDSYWNWAVQDFFLLLRKILCGQAIDSIGSPEEILSLFYCRSTTRLVDVISFSIRTLVDGGTTDIPHEAQEVLIKLQHACQIAVSEAEPVLKYSIQPTMPILEVTSRGEPIVRCLPRPFVGILDRDSISDGKKLFKNELAFGSANHGFLTPPLSEMNEPATESCSENTQSGTSSHSSQTNVSWTPEIQTKKRDGWSRNDEISNTYCSWFRTVQTYGFTLSGKSVLVTGAGKASIGSELVCFCLSAGARVFVTTSSYSRATVDYYQELYSQYGARNSSLDVLPFNGGSRQDVIKLVNHIYDDIGIDLDYVIPFAAVSEIGCGLDEIGDRSEVSHRVMLTNVLRLLGAIKNNKAQRYIVTDPTHVLLPLSPNHGTFGHDGLYGESKVGLEVLMNKWWSEDWHIYLSLCGVTIGWTRGTGLMTNNDIFAPGLEEALGVQTFSSREMAWHIVGLMSTDIVGYAELEPLKVDLSGGLSSSRNLKHTMKQIQLRVHQECDMKRVLWEEQRHDETDSGNLNQPLVRSTKKANIRVGVPKLPDFDEELETLAVKMHGTVDLDRVPVIVGIGEAGPCGSTRTRWQIESTGTFSIEGCLELAWIMGLITYHSGLLRGEAYCGWLDKDSGSPITDMDVKSKYEAFILQNTGIRKIEKRAHDFAEPDQEESLHEVVIPEDLKPFECPMDIAKDLLRVHGDNVVVRNTGTDQATVFFRAGATLYIPKASSYNHGIGSQMPAGWNAKVYGISDDIVAQVDPVTLYALVATVEALISAGLPDPFELYDHVSVGEVGNAIGSGFGGQRSLHAMFKQRYRDVQVQKDILAETFVNTTAAWVNMLLLGSSGPIRTPVGACATSLESVDTGCDLIRTGKAKAVVVGGSDSLEREAAHEFANMGATINATKDAASGRDPKQASRPTTSTRAGFVEGEGCGVQLMTTASLAIKLGLPVRAVVALAYTASDKIGRSVPAPGKGLLTIAAEKPTAIPSPLLDISYRRRQLEHRRRQIEEQRDAELEWIEQQLPLHNCEPADEQMSPQYIAEWRNQIQHNSERAFRDAQYDLGNDFARDETSISPLRGALAVWGLTIDDLSFASLHGTSTKANDSNETAVLQSMLQALNRTRGNVMPCVLQKSLMGHGKAAAGGFALNGCTQILDTGIIPGNRNADNIDADLADRDFLFFPSRTFQTVMPMRAFCLTSFGFGQKGAQVIGVHPRYLFAHLRQDEYESYREKVGKRMAAADQFLQKGIYGGKLVQLKERAVHEDDDELLTKR